MDAANKAIAHTITTPKWMLDFLDDFALRRGLTRSAVLTAALRVYLQIHAPEEFDRRVPPVTTGAHSRAERS